MTAPSLHLLVPGPLDQVSGGYRYDRRVVQGLRARGWRVAVLALEGRHPRPDPPTVRAAERALAGLPDGAALLVDGLALPALARGLARERRLRPVALVHHPLWSDPDLAGPPRAAACLRALEAAALACARRVLVPSAATAGALAAMGVAAGAVAIVPPGTDPAPVARGSGGAAPSLLAVGTVTPRKGHGLLVEALGRLRHLPWRLTVVGRLDRDPGQARAVAAAAAAAGLGDRVVLAGGVDERALAAAYDGADLFVQASRQEGYGMALAEALARGLPAVATAVGAAPELLAAGAGITAVPGSVDALAAALHPTLVDGAMRARMAAAARNTARTLPSWQGTVDRFALELAMATRPE